MSIIVRNLKSRLYQILINHFRTDQVKIILPRKSLNFRMSTKNLDRYPTFIAYGSSIKILNTF